MSEPTQAELAALAGRYADMVMDLATLPEIMAHSEALLDAARADGNADLIRIFETANLLARHRYGKIGGAEQQVRLAEKIRRRGRGDGYQAAKLAEIMARALDAGDADFFAGLGKAQALATSKPSATSDAVLFALIVARDFRAAGIEPTKADVRDEVTDLMAKEGRAMGEPRWQRDVWPSHPELATLGERRRGQERQRLPAR